MYIFQDGDERDLHKEYDIKGEDYKTLIDTCFKYCDTFSLLLYEEHIKMLEFVLPEPIKHCLYDELNAKGSLNRHIFYYRCDDKAKQFLLSQVGSLFEWINAWGFNNPEDPVFYRSDGSIFFYSVIHEGECYIDDHANEDVSAVIRGEGWKSIPHRKFTL